MNNLKNVSLEIPKDKLVTFTGVSGSGKSSLLFDTIYTEAQRQLVETFSTFARTRMPKLSRPDVDDILNLSTPIVIDQKRLGKNLRSTVGTVTEVNTYLRLIFSRLAQPPIGPSFMYSFNHPEGMCPVCHGLGKEISVDMDLFLDKSKSLSEGAIMHPHYKPGSYLLKELIGLELFDNHKKLSDFEAEELNRLLYSETFEIENAKEKLSYKRNFEGLIRKLEKAIRTKADDEGDEEEKNAYSRFFVYRTCSGCNGTRLNEKALKSTIHGKNIAELCQMELNELLDFISRLTDQISETVLRKVKFLLEQLIEIGVSYLTLDRAVSTLSGGESQRVKMAKQLDCNLVDLLYILDEPSIGLHARDTQKLMEMLKKIKDKGNSVLIVEHDPDIILSSEWIIDVGPEAGSKGGCIVYNGEPDGLRQANSITAKYLFQNEKPVYKRKSFNQFYPVRNANVNNLKNLDVNIPKGVLTCITGVAGSGKSSLIHECFLAEYPESIVVDQNPVGKSSRATLATYIGVFDLIRKEYALHNQCDASLFSFNSKGACPKCNGSGSLSYELHFLDTVKTVCDECEGKRYHSDVLAYTYKGLNIADLLNTSVAEAKPLFHQPKIRKLLQVLQDTGLSYLKLGQTLSTLSGGELQRLKLASELHKEGNIYVMDEPTTGLHLSDIHQFYQIIKSLTDKDNTVIIIEHNLEIIRYADWIIDMGPEGGKNGGQILFKGRPEDLIKEEKSHTAVYLKEYL